MNNKWEVHGWLILFAIFYGCRYSISYYNSVSRIRQLVDTVGIARYSWQMDSILSRLNRDGRRRNSGLPWKNVICPHDDYTYVAILHPEILNNIKAKNLILIDVAHRAARLKIEDYMVFDSYSGWNGPWHTINISPARKDLKVFLDDRYSIVNDSLHSVEHSLEALIQFLQFFNKDISIIPIPVPALFSYYTPDSANLHKYKWNWCVRYSLPFAMYAGYFFSSPVPLYSEVAGYSISITGKQVPVNDLRMGRTAIATRCNWIGYAAIGYK